MVEAHRDGAEPAAGLVGAQDVVDDIARSMVAVPRGEIVLRDEGSGRTWAVAVGATWMARHPVTRRQYDSSCGSADDRAAGDVPVTDVSWHDAIAFCNRLSAAAGLTPCYAGLGHVDAEGVTWTADADGYRLPTEAEWEHACRAGSDDVRYGPLDEIAWHRGNSGGTVHPVATRAPNEWGLFDMIGNTWEWCWDQFDTKVYGPYRVFRGGGFTDVARGCRASCRRKSHPSFRIDDLGFRVVRSR